MPQSAIHFPPPAENSTITLITSTPLSPSDFAFATPIKIWGIGLFFVTLISSCAAVGIMLMPCLSKRTYNTVLTYFIGLGVGSLSGSAIFHLLPQAFDLVEPQVPNPNQPGHSYLWKSWVAVFGVFLFFLVDKLLKLFMEFKKVRKTRLNSSSTTDSSSNTHRNHDHHHHQNDSNHQAIRAIYEVQKNSSKYSTSNDDNLSTCNYNNDDGDSAFARNNSASPIVAPVVIDDRKSKAITNGGVVYKSINGENNVVKCRVLDESDYKVEIGCSHSHSIVDPETGRPRSVIATVAWMIIFGDGLHNFIDGLSIGASFSTNILSGISISVAVLCEEFPHELGDVAILVASGMTMKQALFYNLLSAGTCYIGFVIGVVVGELRQVSYYIFALAAGCFLYISLGNMISEMNKEMERSMEISLSKACKTLALQTSGVLTGLLTMFLMAYFGSSINFA